MFLFARQEPRQETFLGKVKHASLGYFARNPFKNDGELIEGVKEDIANFLFAFPEDFKAQYVDYLYWVFQWIGRIIHTGTKQIAVNQFWYNKNILSIFLVHGKTTDPSVRRLGAVCFKTEAGIYAGEPINLFPSKMEIESPRRPFPKHMLFAQGVKNKTIMDLKINDIFHWLNSLDF